MLSHWVHVAEGDGREVHRLGRVLQRVGVDGVVEVVDTGGAELPYVQRWRAYIKGKIIVHSCQAARICSDWKLTSQVSRESGINDMVLTFCQVQLTTKVYLLLLFGGGVTT